MTFHVCRVSGNFRQTRVLERSFPLLEIPPGNRLMFSIYCIVNEHKSEEEEGEGGGTDFIRVHVAAYL